MARSQPTVTQLNLGVLGLEAIFYNPKWPTGEKGRKMIMKITIYCHFRSISRETSTYNIEISECFLWAISELDLLLIPALSLFRAFWHARAKIERNC